MCDSVSATVELTDSLFISLENPVLLLADQDFSFLFFLTSFASLGSGSFCFAFVFINSFSIVLFVPM